MKNNADSCLIENMWKCGNWSDDFLYTEIGKPINNKDKDYLTNILDRRRM